MLSEMTWGQFSAWQAYMSVEPFGEFRADLRSGIVASVTANAFLRDPKKQPEPYKPTDFLLRFGATDGGDSDVGGVGSSSATPKPVMTKEAWASTFKAVFTEQAKSQQKAADARKAKMEQATVRRKQREAIREARLAARERRQNSSHEEL